MARLETSDDGEQTEMFIDGNFVASWARVCLTDAQRGIVCNMIEHAVQYGESKKAAEIRKALGAK